MPICAGIDAGSRAIKIVLLDATTREVIVRSIADQQVAQQEAVTQLFAQTLEERGLTASDIAGIVATGYARQLVHGADKTYTEITCHARGVAYLAPEVRTVIEIGGQDSKVLWLDERGAMRDFAMNDRCAAGSGRFLEAVAARMSVSLTDIGVHAARSHTPVTISSTCVVFAETEIIGLLAAGVPIEDIIAGVQGAIAHRVATLTGGRVIPPVYFTGGVALVPGMAEALATTIGYPVQIASSPQFSGALGAALLACEEASEAVSQTSQ